jgi:hypothetical protein
MCLLHVILQPTKLQYFWDITKRIAKNRHFQFRGRGGGARVYGLEEGEVRGEGL